MTLRPRPTTLLAAALGLLLGACGGSLYDAAGVPRVEGGAQCNPATQHTCPAAPNVCQSNGDPDFCGHDCLVCPGAPANGTRACVEGGAGAWGCGFTCTAPARACTSLNACLPDDVNACGPSCQACTAPANATPTCGPVAGGVNGCGFTCAPGFLAAGGGCERASAIAAGASHACAVTTGGGLTCWGSNLQGQLGVAGAGGPAPREVFASGVTAVAAGASHTCAIHLGQVKCWGSNAAGQLGTGAVGAGGSTPQVVTLAGAAGLAAGASHTCAWLTSGAVFCWGSNLQGQLGTGNLLAHPAPFASLVTSGAVQVAASADTTCAIAAGAVKCWGANESGQTGKGSTSAAEPTPVPVGLTGTPLQISVGGRQRQVTPTVVAGFGHACAVMDLTGLFCWGTDAEWQLGTSTPPASGLVPVAANKIDNNGRAGVVATGEAFTCVGRAAAIEVGLACSGRSSQGQIGLSAGGNPANDGNVGLSSHAVAVTAGADHACALVGTAPDLAVECWGSNVSGQLGRATAGSFDATPGLVGP